MNSVQRIDHLEAMFAEFSKNAVTREEFNSRMTAIETRMSSLEARMMSLEDRMFRWAIGLMSVQLAIAGMIWFR